MCGRFVGFRKMEELQSYFPIDTLACSAIESFNVAPSQEVLVIHRQEGKNILDKFHWGLVPFWAKDTHIGSRLINARAETVAEKPSFRNAFKHRRCLILTDGFYEWQGAKGNKQPVFITLPDKSPFAFAGLWESWRDKANDNAAYRSCTIITTQASASIRKVHHRMPVALHPDIYGAWLDASNRNPEQLLRILNDSIHRDFVYHPVSKQVNSVKNNAPSNIEPMTQTTFDFNT
jgi:putative SOS response-associated peptidase YedK